MGTVLKAAGANAGYTSPAEKEFVEQVENLVLELPTPLAHYVAGFGNVQLRAEDCCNLLYLLVLIHATQVFQDGLAESPVQRRCCTRTIPAWQYLPLG